MNKLFLVCLFFISINCFGQKVCGFDKHLADFFFKSPTGIEQLRERERLVSLALLNHSEEILPRSIRIIPVVFHNVYKKNEHKIPESILLEQLALLNKDISTLFLEKIPHEFQHLAGVLPVRFCLAKEIPGSPHPIIYVKTNVDEIGRRTALYDSGLGGSTAWDTEQYLNIWIADTGPYLSGFGTFPGTTSKDSDGVVVNPAWLGWKNKSQGKTLLHEIGHYFGLYHTWGLSQDCLSDDFVDDTPPQASSYTGCPDYPQVSCESVDMHMNYMDYVDDACMHLFSRGQISRMLAHIQLFRYNLGQTVVTTCSPSFTQNTGINVFPNPCRNFIIVQSEKKKDEAVSNISIFNLQGQEVLNTTVSFVNNVAYLNVESLLTGLYICLVEDKTALFFKT